jgi:hypothetical protein
MRKRASLERTTVAIVLALVSIPLTGSAAPLVQIPVLTGPRGEFQPARGDSALAWEQNSRRRPNHYDVFVQPDGQEPVQVNRPGSAGAMGDFLSSGSLVYQQYRGRPDGRRGRSELWTFDISSGARSRLPKANSPSWEYWPSSSGPWLLFGRLRPNDSRRLFLQNLQSGQRRRLVSTPPGESFIGPGQVNGNFAVWHTCRRRCHVYRYDIAAETTTRIANPGAYQRAPSVTPGGTVYFSRGGKGCGASVSLVRETVDGTQEVLAELQNVLDIRDTYVHVQPNGSIDVYYERNGCGKAAASDVYRVRDPALVTLTVQLVGPGSGTVTSTPAGINCGADCAEDVERGTAVTLSAGSGVGSVLAGWDGACSGVAPCHLSMDSAKIVSATFLPIGTVLIRKDAVPDDPRDFDFVNNLGGNLHFVLDDDGDSSRSNIELRFVPGPGTYAVEESQAPGWNLLGIRCLDPTGDSQGEVSSRTATIRVGLNEAVACTFTNARAARLNW